MSDDDFTLKIEWLASSNAFRFRLTHKSDKCWDYMVDRDELDHDPKLQDKIVANLRAHAEKEMYESAEESREKDVYRRMERRFIEGRWNDIGEYQIITACPDTYVNFAERYPTKEELEEKRRKELLERHKDDDNFGMF